MESAFCGIYANSGKMNVVPRDSIICRFCTIRINKFYKKNVNKNFNYLGRDIQACIVTYLMLIPCWYFFFFGFIFLRTRNHCELFTPFPLLYHVRYWYCSVWVYFLCFFFFLFNIIHKNSQHKSAQKKKLKYCCITTFYYREIKNMKKNFSCCCEWCFP